MVAILRALHPGIGLTPDGGLLRGPHYQAPPCRHFNECGGCSLQHVDDAALAEFVEQRCINALKGQDIVPAVIHPVHLSPPYTRRRVAVRTVRMGKKVQLGFSASGSHRVIDLAECFIMHPDLATLLPKLRAFAAQFLGHRGQWQIKLACVDQGIDMLLEGYQPDGLAAHEGLTDFAQNNGLARLSVDNGYGPETLWEPETGDGDLGRNSRPPTRPMRSYRRRRMGRRCCWPRCALRLAMQSTGKGDASPTCSRVSAPLPWACAKGGGSMRRREIALRLWH